MSFNEVVVLVSKTTYMWFQLFFYEIYDTLVRSHFVFASPAMKFIEGNI
jgi:hypothetical protein